MKLWYKIVDLHNGEIKTLFHGIHGSKVLPVNAWIQSDQKMVHDGPNTRPYLSGFHILKSVDECKEYLKRFTNIKEKAIVSCNAKGVVPKESSGGKVFLAKSIRVKEIVWKK